MIDISVNNLIKSFEIGQNVLDGLTFTINSGERVAILGPNGCGKTTLFRILTKAVDYDSGEIMIAPNKRIGLISQIPIYPDGWTVENVLRSALHELDTIQAKMRKIEENFTEDKMKEYDSLMASFERLGGYEKDAQINKTVAGLNINASMRAREFESLSGGEKTRVNLARLIIEDTDILLLDEPTNHLDLNATIWLEDYISSFKGTVLAVSHDRFFLDKVAERCIEISNGKAEFYNGNYSFFVKERQHRFDEKMKQYERDSAKVEQLTRAAEQMHLWAFMGADKLHKRAFSMEKRIEKLKRSEKPVEAKKLTVKFKQAEFSGNEVLDIINLSKSYGEKKLIQDFSFEVINAECIAIIGNNGTGKSTLIKMITGETLPDSGIIRIGPQVKIGYLPQQIHFENENRSAYDTMLYEAKTTPQEARNRLAAFGFRGENVFTPVGALSGGERSRLKLCIIMGSNINLLLLDEPTNHLDIASREWIESALQDYSETLIFVSHDRYFIEKFATRVISFNGNADITDYSGNYRDYIEFKSRQTIFEKTIPVKTAKKEKSGKTKNPSISIAKIEREIASLEAKVSKLDEDSAKNCTDYVRLMEIEKEKNELNEKLEDLYSLWEKAL